MAFRPVIPALVMSLTFTVVEAQERPKAKPAPVESFETLAERVKPGATVYVSDAASGEVEGQLLGISPGSVTVLVQGTQREFLKNELRHVARRGDSLKNGALIGLGVATLWAVIGEARSNEDVGTMDVFGAGGALGIYAVWLGMGAGVGALLDAAVKGKTTVYRSRERTITAQPIIHPRQVGVRLAVRF